jgi:monoamine oxidase
VKLITAILEAEASSELDIEDWSKFPIEQDVTFAEWVEKLGLWESDYIRGAASQLSTSIVGREPDEIGVHYFLDYIKSGGGLISLASEGKLGAQSLKVKQG